MPNVERVDGNVFFMDSTAFRARCRQLAESYFECGVRMENSKSLIDPAICYRKAIDYNPRHIEAWVRLAMIEYQRGQIEQAAASYRTALEIDECYPFVHCALADCLDDMGARKRAITHYLRAIALAPDYGCPYHNLACVYEKEREWRKALLYYQLYLRHETDENDPDSQYRNAAQGKIDVLKKLEPLRIVPRPPH
jgi:superkiller protein 3